MEFRLLAAVAALGTAITPAIAQRASQPSKPPPTSIMSCEDLLRIRDDRRRWDQITQVVAVTDLGWSLRAMRLISIDRNDKLVKAESTGQLEVNADTGHSIGAVILATNSNPTMTDQEPMRYYFRWVTSKPVKYGDQKGRCSNEDTKVARVSSEDVMGFQLISAEELNNRYALIGYDDRKNILFTAAFVVRPQLAPDQTSRPPEAKATVPESKPSDAEENMAALRVAYKSRMFLERCDGLNVSGASLAANRERIARIEQTAAAIGLDVQAAKQKARQDSKGDLEMFDMFEALGAMNYKQRDTLRQFCGLQGMTLLEASKHFEELGAAGR